MCITHISNYLVDREMYLQKEKKNDTLILHIILFPLNVSNLVNLLEV